MLNYLVSSTSCFSMLNQIVSSNSYHINPILDFILYLICVTYAYISITKRIEYYIDKILNNPIIMIKMLGTFISFMILCNRYNICI